MPDEIVALSTPGVESITEAGTVIAEDIVVTTADGRRFDVRNFCLETIIYEDVFANVLTGECLFVDAANLITNIPFQGTEFITFSFRTPTFSEKIAKSFYITGVKGRGFSSADREQIYALSFISIEGMKDSSTMITRRIAGSTGDVVQKLFHTHLETPRFIGESKTTVLKMKGDKHASSVVMVPPMWSPLKVINWTAARSVGAGATKAPNFLFFESNKSFHFESVEDMIVDQRNRNEVFAEYVYFPGAQMIQFPEKGKFTYTKPEIAKQFGMVESIIPFEQMDVLRAQEFGYYDSVLYTHDLTLKQYKEFAYDHWTSHQQFNNLEDFTAKSGIVSNLGKQTQPFPKNIWKNSERRVLRTTQTKLFNDYPSPRYEFWAPQRNSLLYELSNIRMTIQVPGRTDISVGKLVQFWYPKAVDKTPNMVTEDLFDPYLSGLYFIAAIRHSFYLNKHTMSIEIVKDSFPTPLK